jgi:hypothetical protein
VLCGTDGLEMEGSLLLERWRVGVEDEGGIEIRVRGVGARHSMHDTQKFLFRCRDLVG